MKEKPPLPPPQVQEAIEKGDREALSAMGKKGAKVTNQKREAKKMDMKSVAMERGDHLLPIEEFEQLPPHLQELLADVRREALD
jgi:hypothetical protein